MPGASFLTRPICKAGLTEPRPPVQSLVVVDGEPHFSRHYPPGGPWGTDKLLARVNDDLRGSGIASRFSGEMVNVVQGLLGRACLVPWSYTHACTHGVYTGIDGSKHVVELNGNGDVFSWPLTTSPCDTLSVGLSYVAAPTSKPFGLAPIGNLSTSVSGAPMYLEQGWSFNATGRSAANVLFTSDQDGYRVGNLYVVSLTPGPTGGPVAVSASLQETGRVWAPAAGSPKVPLYARSSLVTFDLSNGLPAPPGNNVGPVFCYYKDGALDVVRRHSSPQETFNDNIPEPPRPETGTWGNTAGFRNQRSCYSSSFFAEVTMDNFVGSEFEREALTAIPGIWNLSAVADGSFSEDWSPLVVHGRQNLVRSHTNGDMLVVPLNSRESYAHFRSTSTVDQYDEITVGNGFFVTDGTRHSRHTNTLLQFTGAGGADPTRQLMFRSGIHTLVSGPRDSLRGYHAFDTIPLRVAVQNFLSYGTDSTHDGIGQTVADGEGASDVDYLGYVGLVQPGFDIGSGRGVHEVTVSRDVNGTPTDFTLYATIETGSGVGYVAGVSEGGTTPSPDADDYDTPETAVDNSTSDASAKLTAGSRTEDLAPDGQTDNTRWFVVLDGVTASARFIVAPDASPSALLIYQDNLDGEFTGGGAYLTPDVNQIALAWVGSP